MELNTNTFSVKFITIIAINIASVRIRGNMNNLIHYVDLNCDITSDNGEFEMEKLIKFTYDYQNDICYWFHDNDLNFYHSDIFNKDDMSQIKKSLMQKVISSHTDN